MPEYDLSEGAANDRHDVAAYTVMTWGVLKRGATRDPPRVGNEPGGSVPHEPLTRKLVLQ